MKYEVLKDFNYPEMGDLQVGNVFMFLEDATEEYINSLVTDGTIKEIENVIPKEGDECESDGKKGILKAQGEDGALICVVEEEVVASEPKKTFNGSVVISDGVREVGGKEFHHIKIGDGSEYDLTDEEYADKVIIA